MRWGERERQLERKPVSVRPIMQRTVTKGMRRAKMIILIHEMRETPLVKNEMKSSKINVMSLRSLQLKGKDWLHWRHFVYDLSLSLVRYVFIHLPSVILHKTSLNASDVLTMWRRSHTGKCRQKTSIVYCKNQWEMHSLSHFQTKHLNIGQINKPMWPTWTLCEICIGKCFHLMQNSYWNWFRRQKIMNNSKCDLLPPWGQERNK